MADAHETGSRWDLVLTLVAGALLGAGITLGSVTTARWADAQDRREAERVERLLDHARHTETAVDSITSALSSYVLYPRRSVEADR